MKNEYKEIQNRHTNEKKIVKQFEDFRRQWSEFLSSPNPSNRFRFCGCGNERCYEFLLQRLRESEFGPELFDFLQCLFCCFPFHQHFDVVRGGADWQCCRFRARHFFSRFAFRFGRLFFGFFFLGFWIRVGVDVAGPRVSTKKRKEVTLTTVFFFFFS
jgi:hypothetical protein